MVSTWPRADYWYGMPVVCIGFTETLIQGSPKQEKRVFLKVSKMVQKKGVHRDNRQPK